MNLCSNDHEEVCYEGHKCPACEMRDRRDEAITERDDLAKLLDIANDGRDTLEEELSDLRDQLAGKIV
jgi:hypothetical protein